MKLTHTGSWAGGAPQMEKRAAQGRHEAFARGKPFELSNRRLEKTVTIAGFLPLQSLRDDQGRIIRWYATGTDIEDRKQAEERANSRSLPDHSPESGERNY